jgi:peptidoglycan/xylan/chitin deacetylase (PgdA/CDA1 family)
MRSFAISAGLVALASALPSDDLLGKRADTSNVPRPQFGNVPYGVDIKSCTLPNKVALTFDDGPSLYTKDLLDLLAKEGARATFFITGTNGGGLSITDDATGYPAILRRMVSEGHQIGSHTWSHVDLGTATPDQRREDIFKNEVAFASILGGFPTYLRPPYTSCGADCMADIGSYGYHVVSTLCREAFLYSFRWVTR